MAEDDDLKDAAPAREEFKVFVGGISYRMDEAGLMDREWACGPARLGVRRPRQEGRRAHARLGPPRPVLTSQPRAVTRSSVAFSSACSAPSAAACPPMALMAWQAGRPAPTSPTTHPSPPVLPRRAPTRSLFKVQPHLGDHPGGQDDAEASRLRLRFSA